MINRLTFFAAILLIVTLGAMLTPLVTEVRSQQRVANGPADAVLTGQGALGDWTTDAPGVRRRITTADLPKPYATRSVDNGPKLVKRSASAWPQVPAGFKVELFISGLQNPRLIRTAHNGDAFLAESIPGRVRVLRAAGGASKPEVN